MRSPFAPLVLFLISFCANAQTADYSIVFLHKRPDLQPLSKEASDELMKGHMGNMERLAKEGKLVAAGPFDGGGGLFIMKSRNIDEINKWIAPDPGIQAKRWNIEILPYNPKQGGICPVSEPYTMVDYAFFRIDAVVSKFTAQDYPQILRRHEEYVQQLIRQGNVITYATFNERDGGILIMKNDVPSDALNADPAVVEGLANVSVKKLYIAKGSFCEQ